MIRPPETGRVIAILIVLTLLALLLIALARLAEEFPWSGLGR